MSILYPRLDVFSCGYLVLSTVLAVLQIIVNERFSTAEEIRRLFYAKDIDRLRDRCVAPLGLAEFAAFAEYSHWRPVPELVNLSTQIAGLALCFSGLVCLIWVDCYLLREFAAHWNRGTLMSSGPYRYIRHPR